MKNTFLRGLSWLVALNVLIKPLWVFGIDRKVQNSIGNEAYGSYFAILNLSIILAIFADAGLTNMLNRQLAVGERLSMRSLLRLKALLSAAFVTLFALICWLSGIRRWDLVALTALLQLLSSFFVFFRSVITGYQQFKTDAWLSVTDKALTLTVCAPLLYLPFSPGLSLAGFLAIQAAATLAALVLAIINAFRHHQKPLEAKPTAELFRQSAPFVLLILLMGVHTRVDAFLLERLHPQGALQAGIYAAAYRLLDAGNTLGYMTAAFLVPFAARHLSDHRLIDATTLRLRTLLLTAAFGFSALCAAAAPQIMQLLYHSSTGYNAAVLTACVAVLPAYYGIHLYGSLLNAAGGLRFFNFAVLGSVLLNAALNFVLIPRLGALGCCYSALASQYGCALALFAGAQRHFGLRLQPASVLAPALAGWMGHVAVRLWLRAGVPPLIWWTGAALAASLIMFVLFNPGRRMASEAR